MTTTQPGALRSRGALGFLAGSVLVHLGNYGFNVGIARTLPPSQYADIALAVTGLLLAGFITVGFQMATARTVADEQTAGSAGLVAWFGRVAFRAGAVAGVAVVLSTPTLTELFRTTSPAPFIAVAIAMPFAFLSGVGRGWAQGTGHFTRLTASFHAEMLVRLGIGVGAVIAGHGVAGASGGLAASVVAAAVMALPPRGTARAPEPERRRTLIAALGPSLALLAGEAVINHIDTIIAKGAFDATVAGQFAGVALLGRTVFFVTWPISVLVFPHAARVAAAGESVARSLVLAAGAVAAVGGGATAIGFASPQWIVTTAIGEEFTPLAGLLGPYFLATTLFAVATTLLSLRLATGCNRAGAVSAFAGLATAGLLVAFHASPSALVWTQVGLMAVYTAVVAAWTWTAERGRR